MREEHLEAICDHWHLSVSYKPQRQIKYQQMSGIAPQLLLSLWKIPFPFTVISLKHFYARLPLCFSFFEQLRIFFILFLSLSVVAVK